MNNQLVNRAHATSHTKTLCLGHLMRRGQLIWGVGVGIGAGGGVLLVKNKIIKFRSVEGATGLKEFGGQ